MSKAEIPSWRDSLMAVNVTVFPTTPAVSEASVTSGARAAEVATQKVGRALSLLSQPFQRAKKETVSSLDKVKGLDYARLNSEAREKLAVVEACRPLTTLERAVWALFVLAVHAVVLYALLGGDAADRLAWPLAVAAPTALLLASSRGDETVEVTRRVPVTDANRFRTLGMLDADKAKHSKQHHVKVAVAGRAMPRRTGPDDARVNTWEPTEASKFVLRGPNYLKDKKKQPSPPALYEPLGVDIVRATEALFDIPGRVVLPEKRSHERDLPAWLPRIIAQTMFFPGTPPPLVGQPREQPGRGAKGWQVTCYWRVTAETAALARQDHWPPHLSLWKQYATMAETMPVLNGCLKGVASVDNLHEKDLGLPRLVRQYNAKPVLMAAAALVGERPGVVKISRDDDYVEFGLDVGTDFAAMSNHAIFAMRDKFARLVIDLGWLVEGRSADQLPEGLLGCLRVNKIDLACAPDIHDWLKSGASSSS